MVKAFAMGMARFYCVWCDLLQPIREDFDMTIGGEPIPTGVLPDGEPTTYDLFFNVADPFYNTDPNNVNAYFQSRAFPISAAESQFHMAPQMNRQNRAEGRDGINVRGYEYGVMIGEDPEVPCASWLRFNDMVRTLTLAEGQYYSNRINQAVKSLFVMIQSDYYQWNNYMIRMNRFMRSLSLITYTGGDFTTNDPNNAQGGYEIPLLGAEVLSSFFSINWADTRFSVNIQDLVLDGMAMINECDNVYFRFLIDGVARNQFPEYVRFSSRRDRWEWIFSDCKHAFYRQLSNVLIETRQEVRLSGNYVLATGQRQNLRALMNLVQSLPLEAWGWTTNVQVYPMVRNYMNPVTRMTSTDGLALDPEFPFRYLLVSEAPVGTVITFERFFDMMNRGDYLAFTNLPGSIVNGVVAKVTMDETFPGLNTGYQDLLKTARDLTMPSVPVHMRWSDTNIFQDPADYQPVPYLMVRFQPFLVVSLSDADSGPAQRLAGIQSLQTLVTSGDNLLFSKKKLDIIKDVAVTNRF